jgi:hypothetical protein
MKPGKNLEAIKKSLTPTIAWLLSALKIEAIMGIQSRAKVKDYLGREPG